jgi:peptide/nickel transport system substrate-binding protein
MIKEAFQLHVDDIGHIPVHQQALAWAMKKNVSVVQSPDNSMPYKWVTVK